MESWGMGDKKNHGREKYIIMLSNFKKCTLCLVEKNIILFNRFKHGKYGVASYCRVCASKKRREKYKKIRKSEIARSSKYRRDNLESRKQYDGKYRLSNREKRRKWDRKSKKKNADKIRIRDSLKRLKRLDIINSTINKITAEQWTEIKNRQYQCCYYCGIKPKVLEMDHVMPLSKGGEHTADNIVGSCKSCNCKNKQNILIIGRKK